MALAALLAVELELVVSSLDAARADPVQAGLVAGRHHVSDPERLMDGRDHVPVPRDLDAQVLSHLLHEPAHGEEAARLRGREERRLAAEKDGVGGGGVRPVAQQQPGDVNVVGVARPADRGAHLDAAAEALVGAEPLHDLLVPLPRCKFEGSEMSALHAKVCDSASVRQQLQHLWPTLPVRCH